MRSRIIGALAVTALIAASVAVASPASAETVGDIDYSLNADGVSAIVNSYSGTSTDVVIPATITLAGNTVPVTRIEIRAFLFENLTSVVLPSSLEAIGDGAFYGNVLTELVIPAGVEYIGETAFAANQITSLVVPDAVALDVGAFENNNIATLTLQGSPEYVQVRAFNDNELTELDIPDSILYIGADAFGNNDLTSIVFPSGLLHLGDNAFDGNELTTARFRGAAPSLVFTGYANTGGRALGDPVGLTVLYYPVHAASFAALDMGYTMRAVAADASASSTAIATTAAVAADGSARHRVTAIVIDEFGDPLEAAVLSFTGDPALRTSATTCTTDSSGSCSITATSTTVGSFTLDATVASESIGSQTLAFAAAPVVELEETGLDVAWPLTLATALLALAAALLLGRRRLRT